MTRDPILQLERATKTYWRGVDAVNAIDNVSAAIYRREMLGIIGPSGSGKTTFLMLAGLVDVPTSGAILFNGRRISGPRTSLSQLSTFRRKHIGFVFQKANLIPFLTASENIQVAMNFDEVPDVIARDRAWSLLRRLGLDHRGNFMPQQLSGGEQQRVTIARAIANRPSVLFADEPTGALDSTNGKHVMSLFREMADQDGVAVCVVTHDNRTVKFFNRIIHMNDGMIVDERRNN